MRPFASYPFSKEEQAQRERMKEEATALRGRVEEASGGKAFLPGLPWSQVQPPFERRGAMIPKVHGSPSSGI